MEMDDIEICVWFYVKCKPFDEIHRWLFSRMLCMYVWKYKCLLCAWNDGQDIIL